MLPISKEIVEKAFDKEKDIYQQLEDKKKYVGEDNSFWGINTSREFHLPDHPDYEGLEVGKVGDIWRCDFYVNGHELKEAFAIWRNYPNYYGRGDGKTMDEVLALSETEKVLYKCKEYRIVLLRDTILGKTDTYWGYRIQPAVYALIDNKDNIIVREPKAWRFRKILLNEIKEHEPTSFIDDIKIYINPFKLFIVKGSDTKKLEHIQEKLDMFIDTPTFRFEDELKKDNVWVCYILGHGSKHYNRCRSWWFMYSKEKPTNEEAIESMLDILLWYDADDFVEMLEKYKEHDYNLNTLDLADVHLKWDNVSRKFRYSIKDVFDIKDFEDLRKLIW